MSRAMTNQDRIVQLQVDNKRLDRLSCSLAAKLDGATITLKAVECQLDEARAALQEFLDWVRENVGLRGNPPLRHAYHKAEATLKDAPND